MSFPAYESYKDSGVEWLGRVPSHWEVLKLEQVTIAKCDGPFGSGLKSEHYADEGVRVVRLQNIKAGAFDGADAAYVSQAYFDTEIAGHEVIEGDLLLAGLGDDRNIVGRACVAPTGIEPAMVKADCFRFRLDAKKVLVGFVAQQLTASANFDAGVLSSGSTRSRIPLLTMATRKVALPPVGEQRIIAAFLHRETAKIDALVEAQERLIALLKEKRQAVISHAVTKGLDPSTPMKDSGVEWLGQVPAHWEVARVSQIAVEIQTGPFGSQLHAEEYIQGGVPVINPSNIRGGVVVPDPENSIPIEKAESLADHILREGDVVLGRRGEMGRCAVVREKGLFCGTGSLRIRSSTSIDPDFLASVLRTPRVVEWLRLSSVGSTMDNLNAQIVGNIPIALPPLSEQKEILMGLKEAECQSETLELLSRRSSALLQERRAALISAAVTGKIDVRDLVQTAEAA